jgi:anti-sigma factor RsiW
MQCAEYRDMVAAHVDDRLAPEEERLAMAHVTSCARCASLLATQRALKQALRSRSFVSHTPEALRQAVLSRLDAAERAAGSRSWWREWLALPIARPALVSAAALLLVIGAAWFFGSRQPPRATPLFDTIVAHYHAVESGQIKLSVRTDDPMELRTYYLHTGAFTFRNSVVDLEPLGVRLVGGTITELAGKKSTLSVYRDGRGMVLCHRIQSGGVALPPGGEVVGGDRFYTADGITICVHFEGDIICFMASSMPRADFVRLLTGHA